MLLQKRIHDWSKTLAPWQRDLLRRLAVGPLSDVDRAELRAILTGAAGAPAVEPLQLTHLPLDEAEHGVVELRSVGNFRNINCLAEGQTLSLKPGLNVIFGKNGTGKSGHSRLLRGVCRAAEREEILRNVFEPAKASNAQTAELRIVVDGVERSVEVDLATSPDRILSAMSIFDASCARIYLTKPNVVDYVPRSLLILKSMAEEQDAIAAGLRADAEAVRTALPPLPELNPETEAAAAVAVLSSSSDIKELEQLATLSESERAELNRLATAAAAICADTSGELEEAARTRADGARAAATALRDAAALVDAAALARFAEARAQLDSITRAEHELAARAFSGERFPGTGEEPWREMWFAAKRYVEAGGGSFPSGESQEVCPLCEQELDEEALVRLGNLEDFVRSDLRQRAAGLRNELDALMERLPDISALSARLIGELRGAPAEIAAAAKEGVAVVEAGVAAAKRVVSGEHAADESPSDAIELTAIDEYATHQAAAAEVQASLRAAATQREVLSALAELEARQMLRSKLPQLKKRLTGLKAIAAYEDAEAKLGTHGISVQLRKLQEATITERLRGAIRQELEGLSQGASRVELIGQASKGQTVIQLRLRDGCRARIDRVLSSGEQAALGSAFFLAEIAVSDSKSAIVLDDPVSSFDPDHREYMAKRLVRESEERQVVIYTHDPAFLFYLQEASIGAGVELHGQTLERSRDTVGIVREGLPMKTLSPSARRKDLRHRHRHTLKPLYEGQKSEYEREADLWVSDLRKGYDQLIEEYVLGGTVRRWHHHVRVRQLFKVKWTLQIAERIDKAMKELSPKSHHEPLELSPRAHTLGELRSMLDEFNELCELTAPKQETDAERAQATMEEELVAQAAGLSEVS